MTKLAVLGPVDDGFKALLEARYCVEHFSTAGDFLDADEVHCIDLVALSPHLEAHAVLAWARRFQGRGITFYFLPEDSGPKGAQILEELEKLQSAPARDRDFSERAAEIQKRLLPTELPECPGYEIGFAMKQARVVGGDFYWFARAEDRLLLAVGDISGLGSDAALLFGLLSELLDTIEHLSEKSIRRLNRHLCLKTPDEVSVSLTMVEVHTDTGRFRYFNGGNPPLLCLGQDRRSYGNDQPALGWLAHFPFEIFKGYLHPKETLVLHSDGLLTEEIQSEILPIESLEAWASRFLDSGATNQDDDRVLLALRRLEPASPPEFFWRDALDALFERLSRLRPSRLFSRSRHKQFERPIGSFEDPFEEDFELILGVYEKREFLSALREHQILVGDPEVEIRSNKDTQSLSRAVTVIGDEKVLLSFRGFLGHWTFENPLNEDREQMSAYLLDEIFLGQTPERNFQLLLRSSLNETLQTIVALPSSYEQAESWAKLGFRFLNPTTAGQYLALGRDLAGYEISQALEEGSVLLMPERKIRTWKTKEMILSNSSWWDDYFQDARYKKLRGSAYRLHHFQYQKPEQ